MEERFMRLGRQGIRQETGCRQGRERKGTSSKRAILGALFFYILHFSQSTLFELFTSCEMDFTNN